MEIQTAEMLNEMTTRFYATYAASFSATRANPWAGWERLAEELRPWLARLGLAGEAPVRVLDAGGGNGRFERFLIRAFPQVAWEFTVADNCGELAAAALPDKTSFLQADLVGALIHGGPLPFGDGEFALAAAFGFAHHVPGAEARDRLMREMRRVTAPGGMLALSLWRFMDEGRLASKALAQTAERLDYLAQTGKLPELEENDFLLGWQNATPAEGAIRYCHGFSETDIDAIIARASRDGALLRARFDADGRNGRMNTYLVFER